MKRILFKLTNRLAYGREALLSLLFFTLPFLTFAQNCNLTVEASSNYETCEGSADATLSANSDGGTGQRTYVWSNGMTGYIVEGVSAGIYTVTVTDEEGCTATATEEVELSPEGVWIMTTETDVTCAGGSDGTAYVGAMTGVPPYTYLWSDPAMQTTNNAVGLSEGTYFVTVTDSNGCTAVGEVEIADGTGTPITITTSSSYATCENSADASATAEAEGGEGQLTYVWSNGMTGFKIEDIPAGFYTVTVTDENGCSATATEEVELSPEGIWITTTQTDVSCAGGSDGTAYVGAMTGVPPYTYLWSDPAMQTTNNAVGLSAGTYFVTVTDVNDCFAIGEVTIADGTGTPITITTSSSFATCENSADASATAEAEGGEGQLTYAWSNGLTGFKIEDIPAGFYTVTVTDENGCSATATEEVELSPEGVWIDLFPTDVSCPGGSDGSAQVVATTGVPPYTYLWNDPAMQTTDVAVDLSAGTYMVTVTDVNGCFAIGEVTIADGTGTPITVTTSATPLTCAGSNDGTANAEASGGSGTLSFEWSNGGNGPQIDQLEAGTYTVTVTDEKGCTATASVEVGGTSGLDLSFEVTDVTCSGGSDGVILVNVSSGQAPYGFQWNDTNMQMTNPAIGLSAGMYTVTVTDANGCSAVGQTEVQEPMPINISIVGTAASCENDGTATAQVLSGIAPFTYQWDDPANQTEATATGLAPGVYNLTVTDATGCTHEDGITIGQDCQPPCQTPIVESVVIIEPTCDALDGMATINVVGGPTGFTFTWTPNVSSTHIAENIGAGVYTVVIRDPSDPTCPAIEETFTVANANGPEVEIAATTPATCNESNGTASLLPFGLNYEWCSGETGNNAINLPAGECYVTVTDPVTNCVDVIEVVIGQVNPLMAEALVVQQPDCGVANGVVNIVVSNGSTDYSYLWEDGNNSSSRNDLAAGAYSVTVTDNGPTGCERVVDFVLVDAVPNAVITIVSPGMTTCIGDNDGMVEFTVDYDVGFAQPADTTIRDENGTEVGNGMLGAGTYCIEINDANGCIAGGACFEVISPDQIDVDVAIFDKDCSMGGMIKLVAVSGGNGGYTYNWMDLSGSDNPRDRMNLQAGTYSVIVSDSLGCSVSVMGMTIEDTCCDNPPVIANVIVIEPACGDTTGRAEIIMVGDPNDYTYEWSPSVSLSNQAFNIASGTYTVTITDQTDPTCFLVHSFTVGTINGPMATYISTAATCDLADGTATLSPPNFEYTWGDNGTGASRDDLTAGFYSVTVTDPNDPECQDILTVLVEQENPIEVGVIINDLPDCGMANGSVTLNVTGGSGNYSYSWGGGATGTDLMSGAYFVMVVDQDWGCVSAVNFVLGDNVPSAMVDVDPQDISCIGAADGSVEFTISPPGNYTTTIIQNGVEQSNGSLGPGEHCLVVTDDVGCVVGGTCFEIGEPTQLDVDVAIVDLDCDDGGRIGLDVSGSVPPYRFNWEDLPGSDNQEDRDGLMAGNYQVTIMDANNCTVVVNDLMVEDVCDCVPPVISSVVIVESTCGNTDGRATVNVVGGPEGYVFKWEGGISDTHQANGLSAGTYTVTVEDPSDVTCSVVETFTVGNSDGPNFEVSTVNANCSANDGITVFSPANFTYQWNVGSNTSVRNDLAAGAYQVTIIDPNDPECFDVQTIEIAANNDLEVDFEVISLPDCNVANGSVQLIVNNGSGNYTYSWGSDAIMNNMSAGTYTVTVMDSISGCEQDLTFALLDNVEQAIIQVSGVPEMSCPGANDGSIVFEVSGSFAQPADTTIRDAVGNVYSNGTLSAGSYCLEIRDANDCLSGAHCFIIKDPEQLDVDIAISPETCIELGAIQLVSVTGGDGNYTYNWSDNTSIPDPTDRTDLIGGDYGLTVTDGNNCSVSEILSVNDFAYSVMINLDPSDISCNGFNDGSIAASYVNAMEPVTFSWDPDSLSMGLSGLSIGTYSLTITDANQCTGVATTTIEEPAAINLDLPSDTTVCEPYLIVASTDLSVDYLWTDVNGTQLGINSVLLVTPDSNQFICVQVTDSLGCTEKDSIVVSNGTPNISVSGPPLACLGEPGVQLTATNLVDNHDLMYTWSPAASIVEGINTASPTVSTESLGSTTYVVAVTNQFGCPLTDSLTLNVIDTTSIPDIVTNWMCEELTMNFSIGGQSGVNYLLDFGDPNNPNDTTSNLESSYTYPAVGTYTITLSIPGTEGCVMPFQKEIEVVEAPFIDANFTFDITECSDSATIVFMDNSSTAFGEINNWNWDFGNNGTAMEANPTLVVNENQQLIVNLTVLNSFGCEDQLTDSIPINIVSLNLPDTIPTCPGTPVPLNSDGSDQLIYSWTPSDFLDNPNAASPFANPPAGTTITYEAFVTDSMEVCMKTDQVTVVVAPEMTNVMVTDDQFICEDTLVTLTAFSNEAVDYTWFDLNNTQVNNGANYAVNPGPPGSMKTFVVELMDANECSTTDTVSLTNAAIELIEPLSGEELCLGEEANLSTQAFSIPEAVLNYSWFPATGIVSANADSSEITVSPTESAIYLYEVSNQFGCTNESEIDVMVTDLSALVSATADPDTIFRGQFADLSATRNEFYNYTWTPSTNLSDPSISNPQASPEETTDYTVEVQDSLGCSTMATVRVTVLNPECDEPFLFFPNAFTPNNDGVNDILFLRAPFEVDQINFIIYTRWGEKVFESNSLDNGWDGTFKGEVLGSDVFGFYLTVRCGDGNLYTKKGNVTLLR